MILQLLVFFHHPKRKVSKSSLPRIIFQGFYPINFWTVALRIQKSKSPSVGTAGNLVPHQRWSFSAQHVSNPNPNTKGKTLLMVFTKWSPTRSILGVYPSLFHNFLKKYPSSPKSLAKNNFKKYLGESYWIDFFGHFAAGGNSLTIPWTTRGIPNQPLLPKTNHLSSPGGTSPAGTVPLKATEVPWLRWNGQPQGDIPLGRLADPSWWQTKKKTWDFFAENFGSDPFVLWK